MNHRVVNLVALSLLLPAVGAAQKPPPPEPGFSEHLFPPELVMQHQARLGLTREQRDAITGAIKHLQNAVLDLQWRMQEETQRMSELVAGPAVDATAALAQVDRVLEVEREVKRTHLEALIKIKNVLSAEQQARLRELRGGPPSP
ncbi:MAG: periplasmic heavy metal sensor [Gemmatimonadetes bacterium]|nr:periplasmic heavy metal sensor [Gemmatimonadota bacterium]